MANMLFYPYLCEQLDELASGLFTEPHLLHGLLCELALYFCTYTEGVSMRHMPEATWFLFWWVTQQT